MYEIWQTYFSDKNRAHKVFVATVFMFLFLAFETIFSCTVATYSHGHMIFNIRLSYTKVFGIFIYLSTSILVASAVRYKYLLIPDLFLLIIKSYISITTLMSLFEHPDSPDLSSIETAVEGLLFSLFLATMLLGKLFKHHPKLTKRSPFIGLWALLLCFPFTLGFEITKLIFAIENPQIRTGIAIFNFFKGTIHEIVLDIPYALLIITMYFVPEKTFKAFRNHLLHYNKE